MSSRDFRLVGDAIVHFVVARTIVTSANTSSAHVPVPVEEIYHSARAEAVRKRWTSPLELERFIVHNLAGIRSAKPWMWDIYVEGSTLVAVRPNAVLKAEERAS